MHVAVAEDLLPQVAVKELVGVGVRGDLSELATSLGRGDVGGTWEKYGWLVDMNYLMLHGLIIDMGNDG